MFNFFKSNKAANQPVEKKEDHFAIHFALAQKIKAAVERKMVSLNTFTHTGAQRMQRLLALWRESAECKMNEISKMELILVQIEIA